MLSKGAYHFIEGLASPKRYLYWEEITANLKNKPTNQQKKNNNKKTKKQKQKQNKNKQSRRLKKLSVDLPRSDSRREISTLPHSVMVEEMWTPLLLLLH